jgi:Ca-activated chloride channel family protein
MRTTATLLTLAVLAAGAACKRTGDAAQVDASSVGVTVAYGSEKKTWLEEQAKAFAASGAKTKAGKPIRLDLKALGSGEAVQGILAGSLKPAVFSPASSAYITLLNDAWLGQPGHTAPLSPSGEAVVLSPVVVALWKPMAEALGWPGKQLGWADLMKVAQNPKGWAAFGRPEWGAFKLGHTHPEYSSSGLLAVLAESYAGAKKRRGLAAGDAAHKDTREFVARVERSIVHYGKSTGFFADRMLARGPSYLSAAVLYENLVIESYAKAPSPSLVSIYPTEGTFWADHPYAILDASWVTAEQREGAEQFLAFLKRAEAQQRALALGFRPADPKIAIGAPIDAAHGADPKEPQALLDVPDAGALKAVVEAFRATKRPTDVALVLDKSGSMNGRPLDEAKAGATAFLRSLGDGDEVSLSFFDNRIYPPVGPMRLGTGRAELLARVDGLVAGGGTSLYDATAAAYRDALQRAQRDPDKIHALVVMTDGRDESSRMGLEQLTGSLAREGAPVKVFTIAYGSEADPLVLGRIAEAAQGTSYRGSAETIVQVYQEVAAFF